MSGSVERVRGRERAARGAAEDRLAWPAAALLLVVFSGLTWTAIAALAMVLLR